MLGYELSKGREVFRKSRAGCSNRSFSKATGESEPEAYPLGYVEDFDEPRTPLTGCFSILLGRAAFRTDRGLLSRLAFFGSERKELFALPARANFEVGDSLVVNVGG